jgi:deazaflavin-dependent oxidoreductase (nitroreductase family)
MDDRPRQPLHRQRRQGRAHVHRHAARAFGDDRALATTGRKSGDKFIFPLFYGEDGKSIIVVASKGGAPEHPGWYKNLVANPEVEVQVGTRHFKARARTVTGPAREGLWQKALKFWPPYADYAKKTEREIPVVLLDPIG